MWLGSEGDRRQSSFIEFMGKEEKNSSQLFKSLNCEPSCFHEHSTKSCESRKSEFPPM